MTNSICRRKMMENPAMRTIRQICFLLLAGYLLAIATLPVLAQPGRDRLILKDGSYQIITKYEVKGDTVRYFSAERDQWEEIPTSLIDWAATEKWKHDHRSPDEKTPPASTTDASDPAASEAAKLDVEEYAARNEEIWRMPIISPGLRLPDESGLWILDTYQGDPELVHAMQANGDLNRASEHSILKWTIGSTGGAKELIRIEGAASRVQLHVNEPVLFISLDHTPAPGEDTAPASALTVDTHGASSVKDKNSHSSPDSRYAIVRLNSSHNLRTATATEIAQLAQPGHAENIVETTKEILPGARWMKITPEIPLLIGEYALIEVLSPENGAPRDLNPPRKVNPPREVNLDVWDFGVNPRAHENKDPRMPVDTP
jgi:hypothetical protein